MNGNLLKEERQQLILEMIQKDKKVAVAELSHQFGTSEVTIRRDLSELAAIGKLTRSHRGALVVTPAPPEPPVTQRMEEGRAAKEQIGRRAAELVKDGDAVFLGSGSTTAFMARHLMDRSNLTVVTNSIGVAYEFATHANTVTVVVAGGMLRQDELSLLGHITELALTELPLDKVFMGAQALSLEHGWTTDHLPEVTTTRHIVEKAQEVIVLADHTKLGKLAAALITPLETISALVTDAEADPEFVQSLQDRNIKVWLA